MDRSVPGSSMAKYHLEQTFWDIDLSPKVSFIYIVHSLWFNLVVDNDWIGIKLGQC